MTHDRTRNRRILLGLAAAAVTAGGMPALAQQNFIAPGEETLTLNLGGILNQFDTTLRLNGTGRQGTDIKFEDNGAPKSLSSFQASGTWRFLPNHRFDAEYFSAKR